VFLAIQSLYEGLSCLLQTIMRNSFKEQIVNDMADHHTMTYAGDPLAIRTIHSFKCGLLERPRFARVQLAVITMALKLRHHKELKRYD
jgi:hypothetical protein